MNRNENYKHFEVNARVAAKSPCSETLFCELSVRAVSLHKRSPDLGEDIAGLMSTIWARYHHQWHETVDDLGQLFADLDLPPHHVVGGESGAHAKWRELERITGSLPKSQAA
jgi:hypothetical protein